MIITNIEKLSNMEIIEHYGIVSGSTVRSKNFLKDFFAGIKNLFGGELKTYTHLLNESRREATLRMIKQAEQLGANAVINVRFATSSITSGASEIYVYGTAVKVR
ncbi:MAG: YbjQ family protein [Bdellovibrionota bacterium]|jgi:uncharacterized protein YbjQ (UPF0145 family)